METFTASNGDVVKIVTARNREEMTVHGAEHPTAAPANGLLAVREYCTSLRDKELGQWRNPDNPDEVVAAHPDINPARVVLFVHNERSRTTTEFSHTGDTERLIPLGESVNGIATAVAYAKAHKKRKAWEDAKPGEVWLLTVDDAEYVSIVDNDSDFDVPLLEEPRGWLYRDLPADMARIRAAKRIYPEGE